MYDMKAKKKKKVVSISCGLLLLTTMMYQHALAQSTDTLELNQREIPGAQIEIYKQTGATDLRINIFQPAGYVPGRTYPAIVFFHGGGWRKGSVRQFEKDCRHFAQRGMFAFTVDYRVSSRQGSTPYESVQDAKSAMRWIRRNADRLGVQPDVIVAAGGSAGGHLALTLATIAGTDEPGEDTTVSTRPAALVLYNPVVKTSKGGNDSSMGGKGLTVSPVDHVKPGLPPVLIFHGEADVIVPIADIDEFCRRMNDAGNACEIKRYPDKAHGFFNKPDVKSEIIDVTDQFLVNLGFIRAK